MNEKDKTIEYVKMLMKEFNSIIFLMLIAILITNFNHLIFTILFIASLSIVAYKIIKVNSFVSKIDEILKEDIEYTEKVDELMKCHKSISKKSNEVSKSETIEDFEEEIIENSTKSNTIEEYIMEVDPIELDEPKTFITNSIEKLVEEDIDLIETVAPVSYVKDFDYIDEFDFFNEEKTVNVTETNNSNISVKETKLAVKEAIETNDKQEVDISKCIRKLPKGRKASDKAKSLALSYGYELKEGETFVLNKKRTN